MSTAAVTIMRCKQCQRIINAIIYCCKSFCLQTSIHGLAHIAAPRRHWIERLMWACFMGLAFWGVLDVSMGQWQRYNESPTVVTLEKDFMTWEYNMPGVTVCEKNKTNNDKLAKAIKSRWNVEPGDEKYEYYQRFVDVVTNSDLLHLDGYNEFKDDTDLDVNLYELATEVMVEPRVMIDNSEQIFGAWIPTMSEVGACYTISSLAVADVAIVKPTPNDTWGVPTTCNGIEYSANGCFYFFECIATVDYYIHSPYDVADTLQRPTTAFPLMNTLVLLTTMETRAGPGVRDLAAHRRHCLYTDEPTERLRQVYSQNACRQGCRSRLAVKLCNCKPFYYFYTEGPLCTPAGMWCLAAHAHLLATFGGEKCTCSQQCEDSVFREISVEVHVLGQYQKRAAVQFKVFPPRTRYTRYIVFHFQDLVDYIFYRIVSFGGAAGLFLGASFISFVEIVYFILERVLGIAGNNMAKQNVINTSKAPYESRIRSLNALLQEYV